MTDNYPKLVLRDIPDIHKLDVYVANDGYKQYARACKMTKDEVINIVKASKLRGRGGACFPTGLKWSFMPKGDNMIKYLAVNGDESEPGSFKDRQIFEYNPHQLIEGILIAGYAMGITTAYIYIRGEYKNWVNMLQKAIDDAYEAGYIGEKMKQTFDSNYSIDIYIHKGAGAYICGEETSLMNSIEGIRAYPRVKPPFPAQSGLWKKPTTINNVETIATVPAIFRIGPEEFTKIGAPNHPGTLLYGVSGHVNRPGVYELPSGFPLMKLIYEVCGGVPGDKKIKAVIPGGSSMPVLRGDEIENVMLDEDSIRAYGTHLGTGGVMVLDEDTDVIAVTKRIAHFYHHESCGQCTPCREGTGWMEKVLDRIQQGRGTKQDLELLISVANNIEGNVICGLGDAAAWAVRGFITKFFDEMKEKVLESVTFQAPNVVHSKRTTAETLQISLLN